MSEVDKYVIQLEHMDEQGATQDTYLIKDNKLTNRVTALEELLQNYNGLAGVDADGTLTSDWLNTESENGLYLVTDYDTTISIDNQDNTNGIYTKWLTSDTSIQKYLNYNNNTVTGIRGILVPAILLVNVIEQNDSRNVTATIIDSNGIIWRQQSYTNDNTTNYYWVNVFDDKANIQDFIALIEKVIEHEEEIASLKDALKNLQDEIEKIKAAQQFETLLIEGADPTKDDVINVLIVGNNMDFGTNMSNLIQNYLSLKGTVVWIKNANTKDALSYFQPAADDEGKVILPTLSSTDSNIVFSSNQVNGNTITSLNVEEFDVIIFIINRSDLDSTTTYGSVASNGALSGIIGDYVISDSIKVTQAGEPHWILDSEDQKIGVASVPVMISYNTVSGAVQTLIKSIHSRLPKASIEVATPITWQKNNTYTMTTSDNQLISSLISAITNICKNMSTTYNNTYQITAENKSYLEANDNTIVYNRDNDTKNAVDKYIKDLCEIIKKHMSITSTATVTIKATDKAIYSSKTIKCQPTSSGDGYRWVTTTRNLKANRGQVITAPESGSGTLSFDGIVSINYGSKVVDKVVPDDREITMRLYKGENSSGTLISQIWHIQNSYSTFENTITTPWTAQDKFFVEVVTATSYTPSSPVLPTPTSSTNNQTYTGSCSYTWDFSANFNS